MERGNSEQDGRFPQTDWSRLEAVRRGNSARRNEAMNFIAERYWNPVFMYIRQQGHTWDEAEELAQSFWLKILKEEGLAKANRERGRFRNFLVTSLKNFLRNQHRANHARKRRPEQGVVRLDDVCTDVASLDLPARELTPDEVFQRDWRCELILYVLSRVEMECVSKLDHFGLFREWVVLPNLDHRPRPSSQELAEQFKLTEKQVYNRIDSVRRIFRKQLRQAIAEYARSEQEIDAEIIELKLQCYITER